MLEIRNRVFVPEHPTTLDSRNTLVRTLRHEAKYAEAEKIARKILESYRRVMGPNHRPGGSSERSDFCYPLISPKCLDRLEAFADV